MKTLANVLMEIYTSSDRGKLLSNMEYFLELLASNYQPAYKSDCQLIEKGLRFGVGNMIARYTERNLWPTTEETQQITNRLVCEAGMQEADAERLIGFLYYMVGWNKLPPYEAPAANEERFNEKRIVQPEPAPMPIDDCTVVPNVVLPDPVIDGEFQAQGFDQLPAISDVEEEYEEERLPSAPIQPQMSGKRITIYEKNLVGREEGIGPYIFSDADVLDISLVHFVISEEINRQNLPVSIEIGQLQCGGFLSRGYEDILIIVNNEHPRDYFRHVIRLYKTGSMAEIHVYAQGVSKTYNLQNKMNARNSLLDQLTGSMKQVEIKASIEGTYYNSLLVCIDLALKRLYE